MRRGLRTTVSMLPHMADGLAGPRFGPARPGVRGCRTVVNDLQHHHDAVAALMLGGCSTTAAHLPARTGERDVPVVGVAALLLSGCGTWRKECPHLTVGVAALRGRACRTCVRCCITIRPDFPHYP
jgi:hypothetical protein